MTQIYEYECENEECDNKEWRKKQEYELEGVYCGEHRENGEGGVYRYNRTLTPQEPPEELGSEELLMEAVREAKEAFNDRIQEEGIDPAYFTVNLQGYQLSMNFKKYRHSVEMYDQEPKGEENG